ncbi:hypothetical protein MAR_013635, partial [Mya arenaria]
MDAIFNLTMSGNETQTSIFSLESATVDKGACICQGILQTTASITLKMFPSGDMLQRRLVLPTCQQCGPFQLTSTLMIVVPDNAMVTGTCNLNNSNTAQEIDIDFFDGWKLSVVILESRANGEELQAGENMTVKNELTFDTFKTDTLGSFACDSEESIKLGEVDFLISNLQYRGFGHTNSTDFSKA